MSLESYLPLCDRLGLTPDLPYTPKWSAAADFLALLVDYVLANKPATIVECGSGMTTLMLARCCALNGMGHVYSLENGAEFAANNRAVIARHGLQNYSTILDAPLRNYTVNGNSSLWYAHEYLQTPNIDMLVIDGPPGFIQPNSRYPALPLLHDRLSRPCTVFLDDAARMDEREIVRMWLAQYQHWNSDYIDTERGCCVLRPCAG